ncbi:S41 family peptidase [Brevundimonas sp. NPDC092305]|uniref:S41 family peptidase n=1 Tax=Brevundimonas sp. NPDC092305 TaxID=3363957 RepID=UPI0038271E18
MRLLKGLLSFAFLWALAACQTLPYAQEGILPPPVVVADASPERTVLNARVFDAATGWIERHYYDPAFNGHDWPAMRAAARAAAVSRPTEESFYGVLSALVDDLDDRHTSVTSPTTRARQEAARTGQSGVSYGFTAVRRGDEFLVTRVRADGPASPAGVQVGWRLVRVNGEGPMHPVVPRIDRSDAFVFEDENGAEQHLTITPAILEPRARQEAVRRDDGVLVLRFNNFDRLSLGWLQDQMDAAIADPPKAIVLDLRENQGGLAAVLGDVSARFYRKRMDYMLLKGRFVNLMLHTAPAERIWEGPVAALIGPGSGSASELLAALLQETGRGPVVGQTSAGAVIGSRPINLPDGGEMNLSIRTVLTGQQRRLLEGVGVTPDLVVEPALEDQRAGRDPALEAAASALLAP